MENLEKDDDRAALREIDKIIGARLKARRIVVGFSQEKLATAIGLTFQQIQKYEKGSNRINASTLYKISKILNVHISYFFDSIELMNFSIHENGAINEYEISSDILQQKDTYNLLRTFYKIQNPHTRQKVLDFIQMFINED